MNTQFSHNKFKFDLSFEPVDEPVFVNQGKTVTVLYLAHDAHCENPLDSNFCEGNGKIFTLHRHATESEHQLCLHHQKRSTVNGVILDCYQHSGTTWSISGTGINCRFDTATAAGVWIPDEVLLKEIDRKVLKEGIPRREAVLTFAQQSLDLYNSWINGECYGVVQDVFELESCGHYHLNDGASEHCWGFYGYSEATEELNRLIPTVDVAA